MGRPEDARTRVVQRLQARRLEIEQTALVRVAAISDPNETADPEYMSGLHSAVAAAIDYGIDALQRSADRERPIPTALLSQARLAARNRVPIDTVLRRYFAGYTLLGDFLIEEAEQAGLEEGGGSLKRLLRLQAALFDRVVTAVSDEYCREERGHLASTERRKADRIQRLLAGELLDTAEFSYDFEGHHLGLIAVGAAATSLVTALSAPFDRRPLIVRHDAGMVWGWLGTRRALESEDVLAIASRSKLAETSVVLGEPGQGLAGWRLTHRQARAALPIAFHIGASLLRYADVALTASMVRDDLLLVSFRELYLAPLAKERDGGVAARETLRAYFAADRNISSAAAALGVSRQTVGSRLRAIEDRLGRQLTNCAMELEAALRLAEHDFIPESIPSGHL